MKIQKCLRNIYFKSITITITEVIRAIISGLEETSPLVKINVKEEDQRGKFLKCVWLL